MEFVLLGLYFTVPLERAALGPSQTTILPGSGSYAVGPSGGQNTRQDPPPWQWQLLWAYASI
jgi:hypothetical protein